MTEKDCLETDNRRFFIYGIQVGDADLVLTIPAPHSLEAYSILKSIVKEPDNWKRETDTEIRMGFDKTDTTGKRRPKEWHNEGSGPMYG
jgi:hypothetical protein